jgi:C-5 cytosine-specific DNA methylase
MLMVDLYAGLGGWAEGGLAAGYSVVGFDIERHVYGEHRYPAQLVLQDVLTLHGSQFKDAALIVASPPCQAYSYRAMPWKRAKALPPPDNSLFEACFRIQREAIEAAGHHIPLVVENVCGAQKWVGRAAWHFGSFYLWGDIPALMPIPRPRETRKRPIEGTGDQFCAVRVDQIEGVKVPTMGAGWHPPDHPKYVPGLAFNTHAERGIKNTGGSWFAIANNTTSGHRQNPTRRNNPRRTAPSNGARFTSRDCGLEATIANADEGRKSNARKAASALIAKIPFSLAYWIAQAWKPQASEVVNG